MTPTIDPRLDLVLSRVVPVPRERLWQGWTQRELLKRWFAPRPWTTVACEIDLRPGGAFRTVMRSPEGEEFPNAGCYLELVPNQRLVFTDALAPGFRPAEQPFFTAVVSFEAASGGTRYTALALHRDEAGRKQHEEMGFLDGWGRCLDQLVEVARAAHAADAR
jgi:uncharacterized protein YndB with AHSA1/START domain